MFAQLSSLNTSRTTWRIKARVTRMWPSIANSNKGNGVLKGYNLILLDDDNFHVHAYCYADNWNSIADKMEEGGLYVISNFYTKEALGSLKPVSSKYLINFSPATSVEKLEEDDFMIPMHKFEFLDLGDLFGIASAYTNVDYPEFAADVIGVLEDFESLSQIKTMYGERNIVKFRLTDGRHSHMVSVWGQHAENLDASYKEITERPIIVILACTKLKIWKKSVQIGTLPSTKIYLNLENDVVGEMKARLDEEGYTTHENPLESQKQSLVTSSDLIETLTLKQLSEKTSTEFVEKYFLCKVKVTNVEETDHWWYKSCLNCYEEVTKLEGSFRCPECKKNYPLAEKRFRIFILAEDATEAYNFVLLDRAAKRIIGSTATKFISDNLKNDSTEKYPVKIKEMIGKEVTLKIQLKPDNILLNSIVFYATDAYDFGEASSSYSQLSMTGYSNSSYGDNCGIEVSEAGNTPGSSKSSNKKIKMEK